MTLPGMSFEIVRATGPTPVVRGDRIGLIALTERGPVETPTLVASPEEYELVFGCPIPGTLGGLAAKACFANGAEELVVTRVAPARRDELAVAATGALPQVLDGPALPIATAEPGAFGDRVEVEARLSIRRTLSGQLAGPTRIDLPNADDTVQPGDVVRIFADGRNRWSVITAVTSTPPSVSFAPALAGPFLGDAAVQVLSHAFALRLREPGRADVEVDGLVRSDVAGMRARLAGSAIGLGDTAIAAVDLPVPGVPLHLDGGSDGLDVVDDEANRQALADSFARAIDALSEHPLPDIVIAPDLWSRIYRTKGLHHLALDPARAIALADDMVRAAARSRDRVVLVDPPLAGADAVEPAAVSDLESWREQRTLALGADRDFAATYAPWLRTKSPASYRGDDTLLVPPSAAVAGRIARTSLERAPWIATGNVALEGVLGLAASLPTAARERLQDAGINTLHMRTPEGAVIGGVRSLSYPDRRPWRFLVTRRLFNVLRRALPPIGRSYVFEPNTPATWLSLRRDLEALLRDMFARGAFAGSTPRQAFAVRVDGAVNPPELRDAGELHAQVAVAPAVPLEFIVVKLVVADGTAKVVEE